MDFFVVVALLGARPPPPPRLSKRQERGGKEGRERERGRRGYDGGGVFVRRAQKFKLVELCYCSQQKNRLDVGVVKC